MVLAPPEQRPDTQRRWIGLGVDSARGYPEAMTGGVALAQTGDLGALLRRTVRDGAAHEAGVVPEELRRAVLEELAGERFTDLAAVQGPYGVGQEGEHVVFTGEQMDAHHAVSMLYRTLTAAVAPHEEEIAGLKHWRPNEVAVQRYSPGTTGITTHRDGKRHRYLVAILTLEGSARLRQCSDRQGTTLQAWDAGPGSLVLLRGPGLAGAEDGRPLHAVDAPDEHRRTSFTLRMTDR
jgi:hypothetical protein